MSILQKERRIMSSEQHRRSLAQAVHTDGTVDLNLVVAPSGIGFI